MDVRWINGLKSVATWFKVEWNDEFLRTKGTLFKSEKRELREARVPFKMNKR